MKTTTDFMRKVETFESLWARYVEALESLDQARKMTGGHRPRVVRGARKRVYRLAARLDRDFDMDLREPRHEPTYQPR